MTTIVNAIHRLSKPISIAQDAISPNDILLAVGTYYDKDGVQQECLRECLVGTNGTLLRVRTEEPDPNLVVLARWKKTTKYVKAGEVTIAKASPMISTQKKSKGTNAKISNRYGKDKLAEVNKIRGMLQAKMNAK